MRKETLRVEIFSSVTEGNRKETGRMIERDREGVSVRGRQRKKRERDRKRESEIEEQNQKERVRGSERQRLRVIERVTYRSEEVAVTVQ